MYAPTGKGGRMAIFPLKAGEISTLYNRVLKVRSFAPEPDDADPRSGLAISTDAKRKKVFEEAKHAVIDKIRNSD